MAFIYSIFKLRTSVYVTDFGAESGNSILIEKLNTDVGSKIRFFDIN
jgi:hypothetical protein